MDTIPLISTDTRYMMAQPTPPPPPPEQYDTLLPDPTKSMDRERDEESMKFGLVVNKAASLLETKRCLYTEHEAALYFAASLLSNPAGLPQKDPGDTKTNSVGTYIPAGVKDAWLALVQNSLFEDNETGTDTTKSLKHKSANSEEEYEYPLPRGQLAKSIKSAALSCSLNRAAEIASKIKQKRKADSQCCVDALKSLTNTESASTTPEWFMQAFYDKVKDIRDYHARHPTDGLMQDANGNDNNYSVHQMTMGKMKISTPELTPGTHLQSKKRKLGNSIADGYDLHSILHEPLHKIKSGQTYAVEEVLGKYLDLHSSHQSFLTLSLKGGNKLSYPDFVTLLASGLNTSRDVLGENDKLSQRKKYVRFLNQLNSYLVSFLKRVSPLLLVEKEVVNPALKNFDLEWSANGGVAGWECKTSEKDLAAMSKDAGKAGHTISINLKEFQKVEDLLEKVSAEDLKAELAKIGMKCGGTPLDRAKRLWCTRDKTLDQLPAKLFTKKGKGNGKGGGNEVQSLGGNQRRVDIARLEVIVSALLDQVRPTLDATARRAERRLTQTLKEKEREMEEEISGVYDNAGDADKGDNTKGIDSDESDDEDAPIYNPKGVPLGWDGKPIPYWLFKLHGLNHFYPCEICGNESYRGRHNFEKHFAEAKHSYGMKCLGIPNTKHFHGVTKIEDAQTLWKKLQENVNKDIFDASKEEEYEDTHGNVLSRANYEDLARQGLL